MAEGDVSQMQMTIPEGVLEGSLLLDDSTGNPVETEIEETKEKKDKNKDKEPLKEPLIKLDDDGNVTIDGKKTVKKEVKKDKDETKSTGEDQTSLEHSPLTPLAATLKDANILPNFNLEEFNKSKDTVEQTEKLLEAVESEVKSKVEEYKKTLPSEVKQILDNYEEGVPLRELIDIESDIQVLENIDEKTIKEDVELQKNIMKVYYKTTTRLSDEEIDESVEGLEEKGTLADKAVTNHKKLLAFQDEKKNELIEASKKQQLLAKENYAKYIQKIEKLVNDTTEILPDVKITDKVKKTVLEYMTKPASFDANKRPKSQLMMLREKDPDGFDFKVNYYAAIGLLDKDIKFDKIETSTRTKLAKELVEKLSGNKQVQRSGSPVDDEEKEVVDDSQAVSYLKSKLGSQKTYTSQV